MAKKPLPENDSGVDVTSEPEEKFIPCDDKAYTILTEAGEYQLVEIQFNAKEKVIGHIRVISSDVDRYQIQEELMLEIEDNVL